MTNNDIDFKESFQELSELRDKLKYKYGKHIKIINRIGFIVSLMLIFLRIYWIGAIMFFMFAPDINDFNKGCKLIYSKLRDPLETK